MNSEPAKSAAILGDENNRLRAALNQALRYLKQFASQGYERSKAFRDLQAVADVVCAPVPEGQGHAATPAGEVATTEAPTIRIHPTNTCKDCGGPLIRDERCQAWDCYFCVRNEWSQYEDAAPPAALDREATRDESADSPLVTLDLLIRDVQRAATTPTRSESLLLLLEAREALSLEVQRANFPREAATTTTAGETVELSETTKEALRAALVECERLKDVPTTPVGLVVYTAHKAEHGRPSFVKAQWRDAAGRRITQFVATCQSTRRDTDADAELIAAAFNAREADTPAALDREALEELDLLRENLSRALLRSDRPFSYTMGPAEASAVLSILRPAPVSEEP